MAKVGRKAKLIVNNKKECSKCKEWKDLSGFYKHPSSVCGRESSCIDCVKFRRNKKKVIKEIEVIPTKAEIKAKKIEYWNKKYSESVGASRPFA